jgi:hypothetical protein
MSNMQKGDTCRWAGRILGVIFISFIVFMYFGYAAEGRGFPNPFQQPFSLWFHVPLVGMILIVIGTLAGWRWEFAGGLTAVIGVTLVVVTQKYGVKGMPLFLGIPGILYLVSAGLRRQERGKVSA